MEVGHAEGGGGEVLPHPHVLGGEGQVGGGVQLLLNQHIVLLLEGPPLLRPTVLEPDLHLDIKFINNMTDELGGKNGRYNCQRN